MRGFVDCERLATGRRRRHRNGTATVDVHGEDRIPARPADLGEAAGVGATLESPTRLADAVGFCLTDLVVLELRKTPAGELAVASMYLLAPSALPNGLANGDAFFPSSGPHQLLAASFIVPAS